MPLDCVWLKDPDPGKWYLQWAYVAASDNTVKAYAFDGKNLTLMDTLGGHSDWVYAVAASADGKRLASASGDGSVKLWNLADRSLLATLVQLSPGTDDWLIVTGQGYFATSNPAAVQGKTAGFQDAEKVRQTLSREEGPAEIEIRNRKSEIRNKYKTPMSQSQNHLDSPKHTVWNILISRFRICLGFRIWDFGFGRCWIVFLLGMPCGRPLSCPDDRAGDFLHLPGGRAVGQTVEATVAGQQLKGATAVWVSGKGLQRTARAGREAGSQGQAEAGSARSRRRGLGSAATFAPRKRCASPSPSPRTPSWANTTCGWSLPRAFPRGSASSSTRLPRRRPCKRNSEKADAIQVPSLPAIINGQIFTTTTGQGGPDRSYWRLPLKAGQTLVCECQAQSLLPYSYWAVPGWLDACLTLSDTAGKRLGFVDDFRFKPDPVLFHKVEKDGEYLLEVRDILYRGSQDFIYRVRIGRMALRDARLPLGRTAELDREDRTARRQSARHQHGPGAGGRQPAAALPERQAERDDFQPRALRRGRPAGGAGERAERFHRPGEPRAGAGRDQRPHPEERRRGLLHLQGRRGPEAADGGGRPAAGFAPGQRVDAV